MKTKVVENILNEGYNISMKAKVIENILKEGYDNKFS